MGAQREVVVLVAETVPPGTMNGRIARPPFAVNQERGVGIRFDDHDRWSIVPRGMDHEPAVDDARFEGGPLAPAWRGRRPASRRAVPCAIRRGA